MTQSHNHYLYHREEGDNAIYQHEGRQARCADISCCLTTHRSMNLLWPMKSLSELSRDEGLVVLTGGVLILSTEDKAYPT